jgi:Male sterility protein
VTCLIRHKSSENPFDRLKQVLQDFLIWDGLGDEVERINVVGGDFGEANFGMDENKYNLLSSNIGMHTTSSLFSLLSSLSSLTHSSPLLLLFPHSSLSFPLSH